MELCESKTKINYMHPVYMLCSCNLRGGIMPGIIIGVQKYIKYAENNQMHERNNCICLGHWWNVSRHMEIGMWMSSA